MNQDKALFAGPGVMLFSAAIFGFFGFYMLKPVNALGQPILFMVLLTWTLRGSAVLFVVSGVLTFVRPVLGNLLYFLVGGVGGGLFVIVVIMDIADVKNQTIHPVLLLLFAAWNVYGSWSALRSILGSRARAVAPGRGPEAAGGQ